MTKEKSAIIYGLQRTGSNYAQKLIEKNFKNISFLNETYARCLPLHKHFRLYDEKWLAPQVKFYNSFYYKDLRSFKDHTEDLLKTKTNFFVVTVKDPYSWYISYKRHAKKNGYIYYKKGFNTHYILDYNQFYSKWLQFAQEDPEFVKIVRYEDLLNDFDNTLNNLRDGLNLEKAGAEYSDLQKVPMSKRFSKNRETYYKNSAYLNEICDKELFMINSLLDKKLMKSLSYEKA